MHLVDYLESIEVYDIKVGIYEYMENTCARGQRHSLTFVQGHSE